MTDLIVQPDPIQPGQESVWDYPRPPRIEPATRLLRVTLNNVLIAETRNALRVLERAHPPTYYFPATDVSPNCLVPGHGQTDCEWKGEATYYDIVVPGGIVARHVAWHYRKPIDMFLPLAGHYAFYAVPPLVCTVDDQPARSQEGYYYGGWVTSHVAGPFKGAPGSESW